MNETPLFMNIASTKTIARKGLKEVVIKIRVQEKCISLQYYVLLLMLLNSLQCWSLKDSLKEESKIKLKNL